LGFVVEKVRRRRWKVEKHNVVLWVEG
jgi:hypothetical protein